MQLKDVMKNAGIVGAGGAGFPAYGKLADGADTLLINVRVTITSFVRSL